MKIATRRAWRRAWNRVGPFMPIALAAGLILGSAWACVKLLVETTVTSAGAAGPDRKMLIIWPDGTEITALVKPRVAGDRSDPCDLMISKRRWQPLGAPPILEAVYIRCYDAPGAFDARSNCIEGYNCK